MCEHKQTGDALCADARKKEIFEWAIKERKTAKIFCVKVFSVFFQVASLIFRVYFHPTSTCKLLFFAVFLAIFGTRDTKFMSFDSESDKKMKSIEIEKALCSSQLAVKFSPVFVL